MENRPLHGKQLRTVSEVSIAKLPCLTSVSPKVLTSILNLQANTCRGKVSYRGHVLDSVLRRLSLFIYYRQKYLQASVFK